jgi:hypothetical protein
VPATNAVPSVSPEPAVSAVGLLSGRRIAAGGVEREQLLDRLAQLRAILPVFAEELASARRQAAVLRVENRGLLAEVRRLQRQRGETHARP